ncbi:MAG: T9SS type A sorting domain-containing protein [Elusimicrobia bacterium]|nr:T9SS type A sorting domain-containing protein [Elusimicrobiota bacterium]
MNDINSARPNKCALLAALLLALTGGPCAAAALAADAAKAPQKFLSPALRDGINDFAVFGPNAEEVRIHDLKGRVVFRATQQGGTPIVWDRRDGTGRVREPGVYIARIRTKDGAVAYQSFVLVK